ncbi:glycosyltransferase [Gephyromycinifex aptenodytis]|uniref:glycosyltransferase n=1 Tax=Gephyromycinifex aptenodytis TaxID=2716227 RepID=UPI001B2FEE5D|nr:glycosyltransferase [Gephyromycinifex aptenodytis]
MSPTATRAPHVLYVAWGFPPSRGGGVYRALATANAFARAGYRVTVLTATRETFIKFTGADYSLEEQVDPAVEIVRIPFAWPAMETDVRKWSATRALAPRLWRKQLAKSDVKDFPERNYGPWRRPLEQAAREIHARNPVDLTVATANPNVDFMAADVLNREFGVPYVMDYRDAWMLNVFDGDLLHEEGGREDLLERDLLNRSREVWFVNEPIRAWHAKRHPHLAERMHVVANGYDPEFAPDPQLQAPPEYRPLTFGYIGTASPKVPLEPFAEGWRLARSRGGSLEAARAQLWGYLGFYSTPSPVLLRLLDDYAQDGLSYEGPVPKTEVKMRYGTFDVALLILGTGLYVTSGKVFEYTASALPIVAVHDPNNAATDVLRDYPLWFPVADLEPESIAVALQAAGDAARNADQATREACREFSLRYSRDIQLAPRVQALRDGLTGANAPTQGATS